MTAIELVGIGLKAATLGYAFVLFWLSRRAFREEEPAWGRHYVTLAHIWIAISILGHLK